MWWSMRPSHLVPPTVVRTPIKKSDLPLLPVVSRIVTEGPAIPYLKFNYIIKEIPTDLAAHDIDALLGFITAPRPVAFSDIEWGSLTNDIQEALSVQSQPSEKVARTFIATFRDENRIQLMRDYALQHIGGYAIYLVHTAHTREGELPTFFNDLSGELLTAAKDSKKPWSGTAMNLLDGLYRASEYRSVTVPGVDSESLTAIAIPLAGNPEAPLNARLPALQLASRHDAPEALVMARSILADTASPLMLVQSAAAVLGAQGTRKDLATLESLRTTGRPHIQTALSEAINKISKR